MARSTRLAAVWAILALLVAGGVRAQSGVQLADDVRAMRLALAGSDRASRVSVSADGRLRKPALGEYDLVALRVEFQSDTTRFTTGTGRFADDLYGGLEPAVDPLPHDAGYFRAHLDFLEHYVERVSDGQVTLRTHLLPEIVQVSGRMGDYAPTGPDASSDTELAKLAALVEEAWSLADQQIDFDLSGFDPERTAFLIFHAGVGRDIELIGTTLDKTPEDLPSLFFDRAALSRLGVRDVSFNGFAVDHTMILPRTETRLGMDFIVDEPFLLELSINGLLAASFFNYLGAPDLFDTETGESAIGPFGLMDPLGIFAYRGLFPPEPTAWTKCYLGWTEPIELTGGGPQVVELRAASEPGGSPSARASVSDAEYFLVENRYRDPEEDGLILTVRQADGEVIEQHIQNGDPEFNSFNIGGFVGGVVVAVDNYDWALPGGVDENENPLNGGVLIWHVDERRLVAGLPRNAVNVGANNRAIDLEEADGAQDIGFPSGPFGPQADIGTPFDYFYEGNPVEVLTEAGSRIRLYQNRFGPDTHPGSETNAGGPSFIVLEDFSSPAASMSFTYRLAEVDGLERLDPYTDAEATIRNEGIRFGPGSLVFSSPSGPVVYSASSSAAVFVESGALVRSLAPPLISDGHIVVLTRDDGLRLEARTINEPEANPAWILELRTGVSEAVPISPIVGARSGRIHIVLQTSSDTHLLEATPTSAELRDASEFGALLGLTAPPAGVQDELIVAGRTGAGSLGNPRLWTYSIPPEDTVGYPIFGQDSDGIVGAIPIIESGSLLLLRPDGSVLEVDVRSAAESAAVRRGEPMMEATLGPHPVLFDLDDDGHLDVLATYGPWLLAFTQSGAMVRDFPRRATDTISGQPLLLQFEAEDDWTILVPGEGGYLHALGPTRQRAGFPLEVGHRARATPLLTGNVLHVVSEDGEVKGWRIPPVASVGWGRLYGDSANRNFSHHVGGAPPDGLADALIVRSETYNWPNPVEGSSTHFRIRTSRNARVTLKIVDAGGALVGDLDFGVVQAGIATELEWTADVPSGLYFARYRARTTGGEEEMALIKLAVIR